MTDLPEGWKRAENTPHFDSEELTLWVSHGGLVGVNEMALNVLFKEPDEMVAIPLSVVQAACDEAKAPSQIIQWMTKGEKAEMDKRMKSLVLKTISGCILTMCSYCKASHDSGQTTEHTCKAKPLWELWDKAMKESQ